MGRTKAVIIALCGTLTLWAAPPASAIVDGQPAEDGAWPAMVSVAAFGGHTCGGTLIDNEWVLSAAHCYHDPNAPDSQPNPEPFGVFIGGGHLDGADYEPVESIVIHPGYDPLRSVNDLALLRLANPSRALVQPLAARADAALWEAGDTATAAGYGLTSSEARETS